MTSFLRRIIVPSFNLTLLAMALGGNERALACALNFDDCPNHIMSEELLDDLHLGSFLRDVYSPICTSTSHIVNTVQQADLKAANLAEWQEYFTNKVPLATLDYLVYRLPTAHIGDYMAAIAARQPLTGAAASDKEAALAFEGIQGKIPDKQLTAALQYLVYAKKIEDVSAVLAIDPSSWDYDPEKREGLKRSRTISSLIDSGSQQAAKADNRFLQRRYALQRLKLMFYQARLSENAIDTRKAIDGYRQAQPHFGQSDFPSFMARSYYAGLLRMDQKPGAANFEFAEIFRLFPPLRQTAYLGFKPIDEKDFTASLKLASAPEQRSILWLLYGLKSDDRRALQELSQTASGWRYAPLLMIRQVQNLDLHWDPARKAFDVPKVADLDPRYENFVWLSEGFITSRQALRSGDQALQVEKILKILSGRKLTTREAEEVVKIRMVAAAADMLHAYRQGAAVGVLNEKTKAFLAAQALVKTRIRPDFGYDPHREALDAALFDALYQAFSSRKDCVRLALISEGQLANCSFSDIESMRQLIKDGAKNDFDAYLASRAALNPQQLAEILSYRALLVQDLAKVRLYKDQIPPPVAASPDALCKNEGSIVLDPFTANTRDCVDCDMQSFANASKAGEQKSTCIDKQFFFNTMVAKIEHLATAKTQAELRAKEDLALEALEVGNAYYNLSYYGRTRLSNVVASDRLFSMEMARQYYRSALQLTSDKELKAKAAFFLAKTENNDVYTSLIDRNFGLNFPVWFKSTFDALSFAIPPTTRYFELLGTELRDTAYVQEIIRECGYFRQYLKDHTKG